MKIKLLVSLFVIAIFATSAQAQLSAGSIGYTVTHTDPNIHVIGSDAVSVSSGAGSGQSSNNGIAIKWQLTLTFQGNIYDLPSSVTVNYNLLSSANAHVQLVGLFTPSGGGGALGSVKGVLANVNVMRGSISVNRNDPEGPTSDPESKNVSIPAGGWLTSGTDTYTCTVDLESVSLATAAHVDPLPGGGPIVPMAKLPLRRTRGRSLSSCFRAMQIPEAATGSAIQSGMVSSVSSN